MSKKKELDNDKKIMDKNYRVPSFPTKRHFFVNNETEKKN